MLNAILENRHIRDTAADVAIRFSIHGQYGRSEGKAKKALARRIPDQSAESCDRLFEFMIALLAETRTAVSLAPRALHTAQKYAALSDIDRAAVISHLQQKFPDYSDEILETCVEWVVYYDYLR